MISNENIQNLNIDKLYGNAWKIIASAAVITLAIYFTTSTTNIFIAVLLKSVIALEALVATFLIAWKFNSFFTVKAEQHELPTAQVTQAELQKAEASAHISENRAVVAENSFDDFNRVAELVDQERLASLGQLTASITHGINNPLNFVKSNINPLKQDIQDLLEIIDKYEELAQDETLKEKFKEVNALKQELELDIIKEEISTLLNGITDGAERTSEMVSELQNFSRLDEGELNDIDLNRSLDTTLTMLSGVIDSKVEIVKNYEELPEFEGYAAKMNQVFSAIIENAAEALEASKVSGAKKIEVITFATKFNIIIKIKDNGKGMPFETSSKAFEPFFSTKDEKNAGLGLPLAKGIIENHCGQIKVESEEGVGTEVTIKLPKN